jgi:type I restriction enzyme, S subunit
MPINQTGAHMDTAANQYRDEWQEVPLASVAEYRDEWQEVPLASVADIRFSSVNKVSQPGEQPVRLCNYTDVYNNDYITADMDFMRATATRSEIERFVLHVGDVIITKDSETPDDIGIPAVVDTTAPDLVCGYHLALLRPNQAEVDPTFLAKQLAHHRIAQYFGQQANGTTRYGISSAAIANTPLHLPRPDSQRSASALMRLVDTHITQTEAVIAKLNQVRAGMLHDLLSYGLDKNGQLRAPIAHPEHFKGSPLGRIPRAWDVVSLSEIAEILFSNVDKVSKSGEKPIRLCNYIDIYNNDYIEADMDFMHATATLTEIMKYSLKMGDVVITKDSETPNDIGIPSVVITTGNNLLCGYHLALIRPSQKSLNSVFLAKQFESKRVTKYFSQQANGTTRYGLSTSAIANIPITLPEIDEQNLIAKRINESHEQIETLKKELDKLKHLKSGLQDDLLFGRVRVPETIMEGAARA